MTNEQILEIIERYKLRIPPTVYYDLKADIVNCSEIPTGLTTKNDIHCLYTDEEIAQSFIEDVEAVKDLLPCGEQMDFPSTFDEFAKDYGFKDKDEVYTNGSELIPVFRVKQWLEHISTTKNDKVDCEHTDCKNCVNHKYCDYEPTTKNHLEIDCIVDVLGSYTDLDIPYKREIAENILTKLPSITPQEPRKGHWIETAEEYYKAINEKGGGVNENTPYFTDDIACSECLAKFSVIDNEAERFDFCPCCGSDNK